jgi:alginate O-acetyltransferase complex protein AlgI
MALLIYYISPKRARNTVLLILSLIFYSWGEPIYICLIIFYIVFDYISALLIEKYRESRRLSKIIFINMILINVGALGFFKYLGFIIDNINALFGSSIVLEKLSLPLGISFYTFQIISYVIEVYLGRVKAEKNIINFAAYVTMFPQFAAGPIMKYSEIITQLKNRTENINQVAEGIERFILGLGKKVLIANNIAGLWTSVKGTPIAELSVASAWLGIIAFTLQIYFDFSGYSDMAIGVGKMFGFELIENFNYPYISKSVSEFWRRWHISLGRWFKDYIYIPLGGNRVNLKKQIRNIFIVWFTTGLWHGASWNFIFWGLYFGFFVFIEKAFLLETLRKLPSYVQHLYTMLVVIIGWVFFDINKLSSAFTYIKVMFGLNKSMLIDNTFIYYSYSNLILFIIAIACATPIINKAYDRIKANMRASGAVSMVLLQIFILFLSTVYLVNQGFSPFLYLKF